MANYFVLDCNSPLTAEFFNLDVNSSAKKRWKSGVLFSKDDERSGFHPPDGMIELTTDTEDDPTDRIYAELYWHPIPLMTRRLVAALQKSGIDNLQTYDTTLINPLGDNPPPPDHYLAVNVVGLVAAADLGASKTNPAVPEDKISMDFYSLAVDAAKARNHLMFRLAENISAVLVHEHVRKTVEAAGINTLSWFKPEEWAG